VPVELSADEINAKIGEYYNELSEMLECLMNKQRDINIQELLKRIENDLHIIVDRLASATPEFRKAVAPNLENFSVIVSKCHDVVKNKMEEAKAEVHQAQQHRQGIQQYNALRQK
jgi:cob(I)alamin adenosyltransferase